MSDIEKDALDRLANDQSQLRVLQQGEQCRQSRTSAELTAAPRQKRLRWAVGILNDKEVEEVPGSVLLLSGVAKHNVPLGRQYTPRATSATSLPSPFPPETRGTFSYRPTTPKDTKKRTRNGKTILDPQPEDSKNDPLNWSAARRDTALLTLGLYCMVGGGMTPLLAAGFTNIAADYHVTVPKVALTTGLYMLGLGLGSVIMSPTAIAYGKRPVYLLTSFGFIVTAVWCALSPSYTSLVVARVFQGLFVSPIECLPSATIAEIYFLHERAYRLGVYTLLLLGGKNLVPLVSAAIIQSLGWRWVFWITAMLVGFCSILLFLFLPETFWDRTPRPHQHHVHLKPASAHLRALSSPHFLSRKNKNPSHDTIDEARRSSRSCEDEIISQSLHSPECQRLRARFVKDDDEKAEVDDPRTGQCCSHSTISSGEVCRSQNESEDAQMHERRAPELSTETRAGEEKTISKPEGASPTQQVGHAWTNFYRESPPKTFLETLKPWDGRINYDNWFRVAFRPFILFAYPSILWSTAIYSLSIGWLIVLSECAATIYRSPDTYHFSALSTGLIYISPFIGGVMGTAVAGKLSDIIVRFMARRNEGVYEPEFRLVMAIPVAISTTIGLMGYGWSAEVHDSWIVPTVFFGIISFGCSLGSTTAITFAVDSYRQYAGEALVTLNFSKNILHGLVFSLFFDNWLDSDGSKEVFVALGGIQLAFLLFSIPMYIFGKRARMWTVRRNFMEKF